MSKFSENPQHFFGLRPCVHISQRHTKTTVCNLTVPVPSLVMEEGNTNHLRCDTASLSVNTLQNQAI